MGADYLPQLQQELLAVIARYEKIDLSNVTVNLDHSGGCEVLELNIVLPEAASQAAARAPSSRSPRSRNRQAFARSAAFTCRRR